MTVVPAEAAVEVAEQETVTSDNETVITTEDPETDLVSPVNVVPDSEDEAVESDEETEGQ